MPDPSATDRDAPASPLATPQVKGRYPVWLLDAGEEHLRLAEEYLRRRESLPRWALVMRSEMARRERHHRRVSHAFFKGAADYAGAPSATRDEAGQSHPTPGEKPNG